MYSLCCAFLICVGVKADDKVSRRLQELGTKANAKYDGEIRYTRLSSSIPRGDPCDERLFQGSFACCWRVRQATTGQWSYYRWICDSTPSSTNCEDADKPMDHWTRKYDQAYVCRREELGVSPVLTFVILFSTNNGSPLSLSVEENGNLNVEVIRSIAAMLGVNVASISVVETTDLMESGSTSGSRSLTISVKIEQDALNGTVGVGTGAMRDGYFTDNDKVEFMSSLTQSLQSYSGAFSNVFVAQVVVSKEEKTVYGSAFADAAYRVAASACCLVLVFMSTARTFS